MSYPTPLGSHSTPSSSATPTRHTSGTSSHHTVNYHDFTSPSAYLNDTAFTYTEPNTPYVQNTSHDQAYATHDSSGTQWSTSVGMASTSSGHAGSSLHHPQPVATHHQHVPSALSEDFGMNFDEFGRFSSPTERDHSTPPAHTKADDQATPVVNDTQQSISVSSFPQPPSTASTSSSSSMASDPNSFASSQHEHVTPEMLMSPFQPMSGQHNDPYSYMHVPQHTFNPHQHHSQPAYVNPSAFQPQPPTPQHFHPQDMQPHSAPPYMYQPNGSPLEPTTPGFMPTAQMVMTMPPAFMTNPTDGSFDQVGYMAQHQRYAGWSNNYGPARSRAASPTSSISSSAVSLVRSASTCSDLHHKSRPKVKLSFKDKADIVALHKRDSSLRQEDIARIYGVDRSTISKILLSSSRWENPQAIFPPAPKPPKTVGGRYPAIEELMHPWMDEQIALGRDVRDSKIQERAKKFAEEIGYPPDRFKASAKWVDKFKERRIGLGKAIHSPVHNGPTFYAASSQYGFASPALAPSAELVARSDSATTFSSSGSSGQAMYQHSPNLTGPAHVMPQAPIPNPMGLTRSESDLTQTSLTPMARARSQSSPQKLGEPASMTPSSGKARPSPLALHRQDSYHGTSPSPRRPTALTRANSIAGSSSGSIRRNRPGSLGASVFGFSQITATPSIGHSAGSSLHSPATSISSSVGGGSGHSRNRSDLSTLTPFTASMGGMTISPDMSESGDTVGMSGGSTVPLTPATPAGVNGMPNMPNTTDFGEAFQSGPANGNQQYATMPNKHYQANPVYGYTSPANAADQYNQQYSQPPSAYTSPNNPQHPVWQ